MNSKNNSTYLQI